MEKIKFTEELREKNFYNKEKLQEKIKIEIENKGFSIFEIDKQKIFKNFYENEIDKKISKNQSFSYLPILITILMIIILSQNNFFINIKNPFIPVGILVIFLIFSFKMIKNSYKNYFKIEEKIDYKNILKNKYFLITDDYIFIENKKYKINDGNIFSNNEVNEILFKNEDYFYDLDDEIEENKIFEKLNYLDLENKSKIKILKNNFLELEKISKILNKKNLDISKNIKNFDFKNLENEIFFLKENIKIAEILKNEIKKILKNSTYKKFFDLEKYEKYLAKTLIFPLNEIKILLSNQILKINEISENNLNSEQIILANKRLEIQKNSLRNQILLIDEKIKKLEI